MKDAAAFSPRALIDRLVLAGEDLGLAVRILQGISSMAGVSFKHAFLHSAIERLARAMLDKSSSVVSGVGARIYSSYSYTTDDGKAVAVLKFLAPWGTPAYRVVIAAGGVSSRRGLRGWVRMNSYMMEYLVVPDAMYSRLDFIKPRLKRAVPANGLVVAAYPGEPGSRESGTVRCYGASGVLKEYRSRYIVFIPPIIAWRFSRWIHFESHYTYELEGCRRIEASSA